MYDYARGEAVREAYLKELLDVAARLGLTGLAVYLEDFTLFLQPQAYRGSITLAAWKRLDAYARKKGLVILPLLNLYGHAEQTLSNPAYSHLRDDVRGTTLNYANPKAKDLVRQVLEVALDTFSSPWIHIGFDESWGMGNRAERETGKPIEVATVFREHLTWAANEVTSRGRRPAFWADVPSVYYPEIIPDLPRELIAVDWYYRCEPSYPSMKRWTSHGFDLWVAPTIGYSESVWPNFRGLAPHAVSVLDAGRDAGASGVIFTAWEQANFRFSERLPMLAYENRLATARGGEVPSLRRTMSDWYKPELGDEAESFVTASLEIGSLHDLLPAGLSEGTESLLEVRNYWYRHNRFSRQAWRRIKRILQDTAPTCRKFSNLALAHRRFSLMADILNPDGVDTGKLIRMVLDNEPVNRANWCAERTTASYRKKIVPLQDKLKRQLESWPSVLKGTPPPYSPAIAYAQRGFRPSLPSAHGFSVGARQLEKENTSFYAWYTGKALHFLFECTQKSPARGVEQSVDFLLTRDDLVAVCLDFKGQGKDYLWFESNPSATVFCQVHDIANGCKNSEWHPLSGKRTWAQVQPFDQGWSVEFCLPFSELQIAPPAPGEAMGLAIERRHGWNASPASRWGGTGYFSRDLPPYLSKLIFL